MSYFLLNSDLTRAVFAAFFPSRSVKLTKSYGPNLHWARISSRDNNNIHSHFILQNSQVQRFAPMIHSTKIILDFISITVFTWYTFYYNVSYTYPWAQLGNLKQEKCG